MANQIEVFRAADQFTVSIAATTTTGNVGWLPPVISAHSDINCRVYNAGTSIIFIKFAPTSALAVATVASGSTRGSIPIAPGSVENFRVAPDQVFVAAIVITAGSNGSIYFTPGFGV